MQSNDYYGETKWCPCCERQVRFLASIELSYCVECGSEVRLFSQAEWTRFTETLEARKSKGGRPRSTRPATRRGGAAA